MSFFWCSCLILFSLVWNGEAGLGAAIIPRPPHRLIICGFSFMLRNINKAFASLHDFLLFQLLESRAVGGLVASRRQFVNNLD